MMPPPRTRSSSAMFVGWRSRLVVCSERVRAWTMARGVEEIARSFLPTLIVSSWRQFQFLQESHWPAHLGLWAWQIWQA